MPSEREETDREARSRALLTNGSFVVQAPAGSGKTGLLTQRLLALLAQAEVPEEILAITFTRKAAGEMRQRVIRALGVAQAAAEPEGDYDKVTAELARRALAKSEEKGWSLDLHPSRLRIQTIDALAQSLARSLPVLSRAGAALDVDDDPTGLYDEASLRLLAELEEGGETERDLSILLEHFDNDYDDLRELLGAMLERRDHWLQSILATNASGAWRERLEATLARIASDTLTRLIGLLPTELNEALWASAIRAAARLESGGADVAALARATQAAPPTADALVLWQAVARLLLRVDGDKPAEWRKTVNARNGFPTTHREDKQRHLDIIAELARIAGMLDAWRAVVRLPPARYDDTQWRVLAALLAVLRRLAAHLRVTFAERGRVDYTEVGIAAREALGRPDEPTDLALRLDYRIRHILVDEFQDTSLGQIELLRRLTAGWTGADGRTLFCVGDPMQSIYRFRQADVALFLRVRRHGIENLRPETLTLARNFRSQAGIVDWVNRAFAGILPDKDDFARGAVCYTPVQATRPAAQLPAVRVWPSVGLDRDAEARCVVDIVRGAQQRSCDARIAVLARTRSHMRDIAGALRGAGLRFQAIEFETLGERRAVRDLAALTRALCHADDRIAWFALLRSPCCGLMLADLAILGGEVRERSVRDLIADSRTLTRLSADGRDRIQRIAPILRAAVDQFGSRSLAALVEGTWLALGGPACAEEATDLENTRAFLERLAGAERAGDLDDPAELDATLIDLYAAPDTQATDRLQLMTIHRAKGLEWDIVILPGLGRPPRSERRRLLHALDVETADGASGLILAPARAAASADDPLETFARQVEKDRSSLESARLLYVAATRAREELHLMGHIEPRGDARPHDASEPEPHAASLLALLWPIVRGEFASRARDGTKAPEPRVAPRRSQLALRRLVAGWQTPPPPERPLATPRDVGDDNSAMRPEFDWVTEVARLVGVVVHRDLDRRVRVRMATGEGIDVDRSLYRTQLRELGVPADRLAAAVERVVQAVLELLDDERGRWILAPHAEERSEWALTAEIDGEVRRLVIDRSFVDEDGTRWIIDYKTSAHEGGALETFLAEEERRYATQLERYASVVRRLDARAVRTALYFPLLGAWRELPGMNP